MTKNLAKEFGDFWNGGFNNADTPKETIRVKFKNGVTGDYPSLMIDDIKSDSDVVEIMSNYTGEILFAKDRKSTGHLKDL